MVVDYTDTSSLWCDGIADSVGIRTSAYVWGSMHCSGGSRHSRQRLHPTVGSPALRATFAISQILIDPFPVARNAVSRCSSRAGPGSETERRLRDFQSCRVRLTTSTSALSQPSQQEQRDDDDQHQS